MLITKCFDIYYGFRLSTLLQLIMKHPGSVLAIELSPAFFQPLFSFSNSHMYDVHIYTLCIIIWFTTCTLLHLNNMTRFAIIICIYCGSYNVLKL